jgi:hypothetical protein
MSSKSLCLTILCLSVTTCFAADQLAEKWQKRITDAESTYAAAVTKADNARFFAVQKANGDRLKVLKSALSEATKSGDFNAATAFNEKLANAEKDGTNRPKPKNTVKFGGHEYALIEDKVTWHVAKKLCEEMGGHLVTLETLQEQAAIEELCGRIGAWVGATDEEAEGKWNWVTGGQVPQSIQSAWVLSNSADTEHALVYWGPSGKWEDGVDSNRYPFVCEWESK